MEKSRADIASENIDNLVRNVDSQFEGKDVGATEKKKSFLKVLENEKQVYLESVKTEARGCAEVRRSFGKVSDKLSGEMGEKRFEFWEDLYRSRYEAMNEAARNGGFPPGSQEYYDVVDGPGGQFSGVNDQEKTIEAAAGRFYFERVNNLKEAMYGQPEEAADLAILHTFYKSVNRYFDYLHTNELEKFDNYDEARRFDKARTSAHNNVIEHLNKINDLARKYDVKPLTMRNFITSGNEEAQKKDFMGGLKARMSFDREIVAAYCKEAFSKEVERRERRQNSLVARFHQ